MEDREFSKVVGIAADARENALKDAYKVISKVLNGSKNGPELMAALPIAEAAARIAKTIEEIQNMRATADAMLTLGKMAGETIKKDEPGPLSGVGCILGK